MKIFHNFKLDMAKLMEDLVELSFELAVVMD
jgi:hypothetical protein